MNTGKKLLIEHVDVIALDSSKEVKKDVSIAIDGKKILAVGKTPEGFAPDETINGRNHVALPGFFNTHCHSSMCIMRGCAEDLPMDRWFNEGVWLAESALTEEDVYWGSSLAACEMIRSGTIAFADHYFWMHQVADVVEKSGMKALLAWCFFGSNAFPEMGNTALETMANFVRKYQNSANGRIKTILGPHSLYIGNKDSLTRVSALAKEIGVGVHIHVSEEQKQMEDAIRDYGMSPVQFLASLGLFDHPSIAAHGMVLTDEDIAILAEKNTSVTSCTKTNMKLAMGVARIPEMLAGGVNVAFGTDGACSNNALDMLEVTRLGTLTLKLDRLDAAALPALDALRIGTRGGAKAMGFADSGFIQPGADADLILIDYDKPHLVPRINLVANVVHSAQASDIDHVIIDGQVVMRKRELLTLDEEKIKAEAQTRAERMMKGSTKPIQIYS